MEKKQRLNAFDRLRNTLQNDVKSNSGKAKEMIFKKSFFEGLNESEIKHLRAKVRKYLVNLFTTILTTQDTTKREKIANEFCTFYKETYIKNDFSLTSICSANLSEEKKKIFAEGLNICKELTTPKKGK